MKSSTTYGNGERESMDTFWIILLAIVFAALAFDLMILEPQMCGFGPFWVGTSNKTTLGEYPISINIQKKRKTHLPAGPISIRIACRSSQRKRREHDRRMRG